MVGMLGSQGKYEETLALYQRALAISEKVLGPDHPDVATLNNMVGLFESQGKCEETLPLEQRTLDMGEKALGPNHLDMATSLNNMAGMLESQGKYEEALPLYQRNLRICEKALGVEHSSVAATLNGMASLLRRQGKNEEALPLYHKAVTILEKALGPDHPNMATTLNNMASLLESEGKYEEALPLYERSLRISEKALGAEHPTVATMLNNIARIVRVQGKNEEALPLFERALAILEKALGPDHPDVATTLNNMASLLESEGKYEEALPLFERSLGISEKALGAEHPSVATTLNGMAGLLESRGKYKEALSLFKRSLRISEKALGAEHPLVATMLNNMAGLLWGQGKKEDALPLYWRALAILEKALGPNHPDVATTLNNMASLLESEGKYEEAFTLFERSLGISEKALGAEHPSVATTLNGMASLLESRGKYEEALSLFKRSLRISEKALGAEHPSVATTLNGMAGLLRSQGKYEEAMPLFERSLHIFEKALGAEHRTVAAMLNNIARLLRVQGKNEEALPLFERALAILEKALGPDHPDVATTLNNMASLLESEGKYEEALPLYERDLRISEKVLGAEHPSVATTLNGMAGLLESQGKYEEALPLFERSLRILKKALGADNPTVATMLNNIARLLRSQGKNEEALPLFKRALAMLEKALGPDHPDVATTLENMASLLESEGKYEEALPLYERDLRISEKALGPEHPSVATSLNGMAGLLESQGKYEEALPLFERSLRISEKALGPEHPHVATTLNNLADLLKSRGKHEESLPLYQRARAISEKVLADHPDMATKLNNKAGVLTAGDYDKAMRLVRNVFSIVDEALGGLGVKLNRPGPATGGASLKTSGSGLVEVDKDHARNRRFEAAERILVRAAAGGSIADLSHRGLGPVFYLEDWLGWPEFKQTQSVKTLLLNGNKLCALSPALGELTSLEELSLEANRLSSVCDELTSLTRLRSLKLSDNNLKAFPDWETRGMLSLDALYLDQNPRLAVVPEWLPDRCPSLREISLEYCGLRSFPQALVRLKNLRTLRLSGNKGLALPERFVGEMVTNFTSTLEELHLADMGLEDMSLGCIAELTALRCLDLRRNSLVSLPAFILDLKNLTSLDVRDNGMLVTPPREVVRHGLVGIRAFLNEMGTKDLVQRTFVRLMFVGYQSAGKTKLNYALQGKLAEYQSKSTCGIDTTSWEPDGDWPPQPARSGAIAFSSWDFAGQRVYYAMHRFFLSERALYLLLVDLSDVNFEQTIHENVGFWLASLNKHTKGAIVRVVGTKVDLVKGGDGHGVDRVEIEKRRLSLLRYIEQEEARVVQELEERVAQAYQTNTEIAAGAKAALEARPTLPKLPGDILLSSLPHDPTPPAAKAHGKESWDDVIEETARAGRPWGRRDISPVPIDGATAPLAQMRMPMGEVSMGTREISVEERGVQQWSEVGAEYGSGQLLSGLQGTILELATQREDKFLLNLPKSYVALWEKVERLKLAGSDAYLKWDEYRDTMLAASGFKSEENLQEATRLLHDLGVLLWYDNRPDCPELADRVFIKPDWVLDLLKPIVGHRLDDQYLPARCALSGSAWNGRGDEEAEDHRRHLIRILETKGILHHELLDLHPEVASAGAEAFTLSRDILSLLRSFGLAYVSSNGRFHYIPSRCKDQAPKTLFKVGFPGPLVHAQPPTALLFGKRVRFRFHIPDGFAENVIVSLQSQLVEHFGEKKGKGLPCIVQQWQHGTLFQGRLRPAEEDTGGKKTTLRILLHVPQSCTAPEALEMIWMLSEPGYTDDVSFEVDPQLAHYVEQSLGRFHGDRMVPLAEKFSPYLRPTYQTLRHCDVRLDALLPRPSIESARGHGPAKVDNWESSTLKEMGLEDIFYWQADTGSHSGGPSGWSSSNIGAAQQMDHVPRSQQQHGAGETGSPLQPADKDDALTLTAADVNKSKEWVLEPEELADLVESQPNAVGISFEPRKASQVLYFSHLFHNLVRLDVSNCSLQTLENVDFASTSQLTFFNAGFNQIKSLKGCRFPEPLEVILLHHNPLPKIPSSLLAENKKLRSLNLDHSCVAEFPEWLLKAMEVLRLSGNSLATLPVSIATLVNLRVLDLKENRLSKLPPQIGALGNLRKLLLSGNKLRYLPVDIGRLSHLQILQVDNNHLTELPQSIGELSALEELYVGYQNFGGGENVLPVGFDTAKLVALENKQEVEESSPLEQTGTPDLMASRSPSYFVFPSKLAGQNSFGRLRTLACQENRVPDLPEWVCRLPSLASLDLDGNALAKFPENVGGLGLPALEILCVNGNHLQTLPGWLGLSSHLRGVQARDNRLREIPVEVTKLEKLQFLDVTGNPDLVAPSGGRGDQSIVRGYDIAGLVSSTLGCLQERVSGLSLGLWKHLEPLLLGPEMRPGRQSVLRGARASLTAFNFVLVLLVIILAFCCYRGDALEELQPHAIGCESGGGVLQTLIGQHPVFSLLLSFFLSLVLLVVVARLFPIASLWPARAASPAVPAPTAPSSTQPSQTPTSPLGSPQFSPNPTPAATPPGSPRPSPGPTPSSTPLGSSQSSPAAILAAAPSGIIQPAPFPTPVAVPLGSIQAIPSAVAPGSTQPAPPSPPAAAPLSSAASSVAAAAASGSSQPGPPLTPTVTALGSNQSSPTPTSPAMPPGSTQPSPTGILTGSVPPTLPSAPTQPAPSQAAGSIQPALSLTPAAVSPSGSTQSSQSLISIGPSSSPSTSTPPQTTPISGASPGIEHSFTKRILKPDPSGIPLPKCCLKNVARNRPKCCPRVWSEPEADGALVINGTVKVVNDDDDPLDPKRVVTVVLNVDCEHYMLPAPKEKSERDFGFYQEKLVVHLKPRANDFELVRKTKDKGCFDQAAQITRVKQQQRVDNLALEANASSAPGVKATIGMQGTIGSNVSMVITETMHGVTQTQSTHDGKKEFIWHLTLNSQDQGDACSSESLLVSKKGRFGQQLHIPRTGPMVEGYSAKLEGAWECKASNNALDFELTAIRTLKYVRLLKPVVIMPFVSSEWIEWTDEKKKVVLTKK